MKLPKQLSCNFGLSKVHIFSIQKYLEPKCCSMYVTVNLLKLFCANYIPYIITRQLSMFDNMYDRASRLDKPDRRIMFWCTLLTALYRISN